MLFHIRFPRLRGGDKLARLSPIRQKATAFMKCRAGILLALLLIPLFLRPGDAKSGSGGIPTIAISSVAADQTVTIVTNNFPAGQTFAVIMGKMGTLGIDGYLVASTNSGAGGVFTATYPIPEQLKGSYQIAIRLQSLQGYYSYNWFYNNTANPIREPVVSGVSNAAVPITTTGIPTFKIESVDADKTVTIKTSAFPPNQTFTVMMGPMGTRGINGVAVGKIESGQGGALTQTFDIPDKFKGVSQIAIRAQTAHVNPYYAYNWFYNNTANTTTAANPPTTTTTASTTISVAPYIGIPTIHMCSVVRDQTVTFRAINYPPNQNFTVTMGAMGAVVGAFDSGAGGTFDKTFNIPAHLRGSYKIAIRAQTAHAYPYYSYNWFYNSAASVCN